MTALEMATGFIRRELGKRLKIYYTPQISFEQDTSLDYGMHIEGLIKQIHKDDEAKKYDTHREQGEED